MNAIMKSNQATDRFKPLCALSLELNKILQIH